MNTVQTSCRKCVTGLEVCEKGPKLPPIPSQLPVRSPSLPTSHSLLVTSLLCLPCDCLTCLNGILPRIATKRLDKLKRRRRHLLHTQNADGFQTGGTYLRRMYKDRVVRTTKKLITPTARQILRCGLRTIVQLIGVGPGTAEFSAAGGEIGTTLKSYNPQRDYDLGLLFDNNSKTLRMP